MTCDAVAARAVELVDVVDAIDERRGHRRARIEAACRALHVAGQAPDHLALQHHAGRRVRQPLGNRGDALRLRGPVRTVQAVAAAAGLAQAAIDEGRATVEVSTSFLALILPEIKSSPMQFDALRAVWNRTCDEQGLPQLKQQNTETTEEDAEDGPF